MADLVDVDRIARAVDPRKLGVNGLAQLVATLDLLAGGDSGLRLADIRTVTLAGLLARASTDQLDAIATSDRARVVVLGEVFRRMGTHVRPGRAYGVVRWRLGAAGHFDRYQSVFDKAGCVTGTDLCTPPDVTLTVTVPDFLRLATGSVGMVRLIVGRRLGVRGDLRFAFGLARAFDIPGR